MKWNRKNRRLQRQSGVAPWLVAGSILMAAVGLAYVWVNGQMDLLGRDLRRLEAEHGKLVKQHLNEEYRWARMKSPQSLDKALSSHRLVMAAPRPDQVVRLRDAHPPEGELLASLDGRVPRTIRKTARE